MKFDYQERAEFFIHQGALTNSKRQSCFVKGVYPTHIKSAKNCFVFDQNNKKYIDFICALGSNLYGYANDEINKNVIVQLSKGSNFSLGSTLEVDVAEKLIGEFLMFSKLRFLKTGSDACMAAIRIARSHHGVNNENEDMYKLLGNKEFTRISQSIGQEDWISRKMQDLYKKIPNATKNSGDKKNCSEEICKDEKRNIDREEALENKTKENKTTWERQGLSASEEESKKRELCSMWIKEFSGSSRGLFETSGSNMVVPNSSRRSTPRVLILSDGYHGMNSDFISLTSPHEGIVKDPYILPLKGNEDLISIAAAVIVEPIITDASPERIQFLRELREKCDKTGTILIFDEIITGFRYLDLSVAKHYGIIPDILLLGKAIGGGLPLSAVLTKRHIGETKEWFVSSTFAGDTLALRALDTILDLHKTKYFIKDLWIFGEKFIKDFNEIAPEIIQIEGYGTRGILKGSDINKALFMQEMCLAGFLFGPTVFFCYQHLEYFDIALSAAKDVIQRIKFNEVKLKGEMPKSPFAQKAREQ